jgi:hypothetical protein
MAKDAFSTPERTGKMWAGQEIRNDGASLVRPERRCETDPQEIASIMKYG